MATLFTEISARYRAASFPVRFIYINVAVFLLLTLFEVLMSLFMKQFPLAIYLDAPSSLPLLLRRPWTIVTYMFVHADFWHILFNMLWLYWFGKIFTEFFTGRQMTGLYLLGGFAGVLFYVVAFNTLPYFRQSADFGYLCGASASVMAIVFAIAFSRKDYYINLLFIGRIKILYVAVGSLILDILLINKGNPGGHIAHIGGALLGIYFASQYGKGRDITRGFNRLLDRIANFFADLGRRKPVFRATSGGYSGGGSSGGGRPETDDEYRRRRNEENRVIDEILDKLKRSGYESLTADEKRRLFDASKR